MSTATAAPMPQRMTDHPARFVGACVGIVLACAGLLLGKSAVVLLGAPLILVSAWQHLLPRSTPAQLAVSRHKDDTLVLSGPGAPSSRRRGVGEVICRIRVSCAGYRETTWLVSGPQQIALTRPSMKTGPETRLRADWDGHGPFLMTHTSPLSLLSEPKVVLPRYMPVGQVPESAHLRGLTGPRASRRAGEGFEMRDVHPMRPGDSRRRIDWRTTARHSEGMPWVRGTYATGEAVAVLIVDSRDDLGPDLHTWQGSQPQRVDEASSLDLARHGAASLARALISAGSRVGLVDLATGRRVLMPSTGRRHLERLTYALALSAPIGPAGTRIRPPQVPADAIVYLFSTCLDDASSRLVHGLRNAGHDVIVIDTLPQVRPVAEVNLEIAWRIVAAERDRRIRQLGAHQVHVVRWAGHARADAPRHLAAIRRAARIRS